MSGAKFELAAPARLAQEIRKSKFVANAAQVASEEDAADFLQLVSDADASHNCWAWRVGQRYRRIAHAGHDILDQMPAPLIVEHIGP